MTGLILESTYQTLTIFVSFKFQIGAGLSHLEIAVFFLISYFSMTLSFKGLKTGLRHSSYKVVAYV